MRNKAGYIKRIVMVLWLALFAQVSGAVELGRELIAPGLRAPVLVTAAPGDSAHVFVAEQAGIIKIVRLSDNTVLDTNFLDITSRVDFTENEQGFLGLALHPDYATNGLFYVNYIHDPAGLGDDVTRVSRFQANGGPNYLTSATADDTSEVVILTIDQPQSNHNGGTLVFEPRDDSKAYLYISSGDGGGGGDDDSGHGTIGNGQDLNTLLGKILRIDVDEGGEGADTGGANYDIPPSNPPLGGSPEIWAYGLRNPYRISFDRVTRDLYIGDVGQNQWEEIDHQLASSTGGENYGWRLKEGPDCFNSGSNCDPGGLTEPIYTYDRGDGGVAVIGGYSYRGADIPFIEGHYIFADVSGVAMSFLSNGTTTSLEQDWAIELNTGKISSFGEDYSGELYFTIRGSKSFPTGALYKIIPTDNDSVYVDFDASGLMKGNESFPLDTLDRGVRSVATDGTVTIVGDSAVTTSSETPTLDRAMTLTATNGTIRIGVAPADPQPDGYRTRSD